MAIVECFTLKLFLLLFLLFPSYYLNLTNDAINEAICKVYFILYRKEVTIEMTEKKLYYFCKRHIDAVFFKEKMMHLDDIFKPSLYAFLSASSVLIEHINTFRILLQYSYFSLNLCTQKNPFVDDKCEDGK